MISYRIDASAEDTRAHRFRVTLSVPHPAHEQRVGLPVWIPGSYLVREFARHLSNLVARQGRRELAVRQLDKANWLIRCEGRATLTLSYEVYAFDPSVRAAFLDTDRGFFNGTGLCLRVHDRESEPHTIGFGKLPRGWQIATAMPPGAGRNSFVAPDYDALVDHPFELGRFWRGRFVAGGVPHDFIVAGAWPGFDGDRLLADAQRICDAEIALWHGPGARAHDLPFDRYVFLLNAVDEGQGGLEHRASTALIAPRRKLPRDGIADDIDDGYVDLLGLISHEYFHTWNVKRMRPADFARYDYTRENYTELLWFFEGFTSYYDDLILRRARLVDDVRYLALLAKNVNAVLAAPGRQVQSVAQASFDAWVKYYRSDENTPNATISYYAKGALVALALDLSLRGASGGKATLDDVMRALWSTSNGGPIAEADILAAVASIAGARRGKALGAELVHWVHGTDDLPLAQLLERVGVQWSVRPGTLAQRWGLRVTESALTGVRVTHVLRGGAAERAGLSAGDELIAIDGWRLRRLDDAEALQPEADRKSSAAELLVSRDQRVLRVPFVPPAPGEGGASVQLTVDAAAGAPARALGRAWLGG